MKTQTAYQRAKRNLKETADMAKSQFENDKPAQRQIINDSADFLSREYDLTETDRDRLADYAGKLHPKK